MIRWQQYLVYLCAIPLLLAIDVWAEEKPRSMPPAPVVVAAVESQVLAPEIWVAGNVVSRQDARLASETEGRLLSLVDVGTQVLPGDELARLDQSRLQLQMKELDAEVIQAQAQQNFLGAEVRRLSRLALQNNTAQTQLERTDAEYKIAAAAVAVAESRLQQVQDLIDRAVIKAPFAGVVIGHLVKAGEWLAKGDPLLQLVNPAELEIQANAPLSSVSYLSKQQMLRVSDGQRELTARLRSIASAASESNRQLALRLDIKDSGWLPGQAVRVAVPQAAATALLTVPRDALVIRRSGSAVFRVNEDGQTERLPVTTGIAVGNVIAVSGDLQPGDKVIIRGGERMRPGMAVKIIAGDSP